MKWIETKLAKHGIEKVMSDTATLENAYRRCLEIKMLNKHMRQFASQIHERAMQANLPADLHQKVTALLQINPAMPWDAAVAEIVAAKP